ncbi:RING-H2 finger protein ATL17 [Hirschfeldia incana]|nr:RING-H2 finger protein ATL17 [Hirschfeldia incana]
MSFRDPNPVTSPPGSFSDPAGFAINTRIMLTAIIIILFFVTLMVSLHLYSRCYLHRSRRFHIRRLNRSRRAAAAMTFFSDPSSSTSAVTARGLDPSVIKSLPTFTFSAATASDAATECAVCLSEFEESEPGRVLPGCKHAFHVECIDMWFHSHSSCPLCRSLVEPIAGGEKTAAEEIAISISGDDANDVVEAEASETSDREDSGGKPAASEVSRRNLGESENELTRSHSFRSRVISSTWIFSKERRSASSSSVSSMPVTEFDIVSGGEETR